MPSTDSAVSTFACYVVNNMSVPIYAVNILTNDPSQCLERRNLDNL